MKRWGIPCAKLALAAGLIYWLISRGGLSVKDEDLADFSKGWPWLLLAQVPFAAVLLLAAVRWRLLLDVQGIQYSFREIQGLVLLGIFFNQVLFGSTGGDVAKAYYVARESPERRAAAALTVFIDRALGLFVLMAIACIGAFLNLELIKETPILWNLAWIIWAIFGLTLLLGSLFYSQRVRRHPAITAVFSKLPFQGVMRKLSEILYLYKSHPVVAFKALAISLMLHFLVIITNLLFIRALLPDRWTSPAVLLLVVPLAQIVMAIPITPGAIGTAEVAYNRLFSLAGIMEKGALVSILQRLTYCFWAIPGLLIYLRRRKTQPSVQSPGNPGETGQADPVGEGTPQLEN